MDGSTQSKWAPQQQDRRESHSSHNASVNDWGMAVPTSEEPKIDETASTTQKTDWTTENSNNGWGSIDSWSNNDPNANTTKMDDNVSSWASNDMNADTTAIDVVKAEESEEKDSAVNAWNMMASQLVEEASELEKRISSKKRNDGLPELTDEQRALAVNAWNTVKIPPVEQVTQQQEQQTTQDDTWDASAWPSSDSLADQWKTMNSTKEQPNVAENQPENNAAWNQTSWDASATDWNTEQPSSNDNKQPSWDDNGKQKSQWGGQQEWSTSVESATWNSTPAIENDAVSNPAASKSSSWKDLLPVANDDNTSGWKSFAEVSDNTATVKKSNTLNTPAVQKQQQPQTDLNGSQSSTVNPTAPFTASQHPTTIDMPTIRLSDFLTSEPQQPPKSIDIPPVRLSDIISGTVNSVDMPAIHLTSSSLPSSSAPLPTNKIKLSLADLSNQDRTMIMNLVDTTEVKPREEITIRLSNITSPGGDHNSNFNFVYNGMSFDRQVPKEITMRLSDLLSGRF
ncbi:MAG: hypothetical protein EXX96DRAFT_232391 [Benjaminiella poitrasii]|nr:MAG: hypothetical protein EXX96DRAFT_232391 [Benjaminiella poitrasii]